MPHSKKINSIVLFLFYFYYPFSRLYYFIDQTILQCFLCRKEEVSVCIFLNDFNGLPCMIDEDIIQKVLGPVHLFCLDLDIRCLSLRTSKWLVYHHSCIRKCHSLSLRSSCQNRSHRVSLSHTNRCNIALNTLHRIIDSKTGSNHSSRAIYIDAVSYTHLRAHETK